MKAKVTWILIADGAQAKVFLSGGKGKHLSVVEGLSFDQAHLKAQDIMADRPGRSFSSVGKGRSGYEPQTDPVQAREALFVKNVAEALNEKHRLKEFDELIVAAAPTALGDIRPYFSKELQAAIVAEYPKDLTNLPIAKLEAHFEDLAA